MYSDKFLISRLGTKDPEFINPGKLNNGLTIVSCSEINPNKRIHLIMESLIVFKSKFPLIKIKWYHLGSGKEINEYIGTANRYFENSIVKCYFKGQLTNIEVFNFYKTVPVDLFINVSVSEGIPVINYGSTILFNTCYCD